MISLIFRQGLFCVLSILFPALVVLPTSDCNVDFLVVVVDVLVTRLWFTVRFNLGTVWGVAFAMTPVIELSLDTRGNDCCSE